MKRKLTSKRKIKKSQTRKHKRGFRFVQYFYKLKELTYIPNGQHTFNFRIFGLLKISAPNPDTQASHSIWVGMELILFCCRMTWWRTWISQQHFSGRAGEENGFKIFLQPLPPSEHWHSTPLIMLLTYLPHS